MNTDIIDKAFKDMIAIRGIHNKLKIPDNRVQQYRSALKNGKTISTDLKIHLLQKTGWQQDDKTYNRKELVSLLNFWKRTSQAARDMGPEYVFEKWAARPS